ncbi:MAG TPA: aminoacyl-tRNA hydrolase [Spirochaeta sp.]|nr:aminoacyl-tRNA hydrolase [Spirochaeta sp.]
MAELEDILNDITVNGLFSFSRSGGPGGQNVNKVNTNVHLSMSVDDFTSLTVEERGLVRLRLQNRINSEGMLFVQAQQERSQLRNRRLAVIRMAELVETTLVKKAARKKTKPSRASKQRRLNEKKRRSEKKKNRRSTDFS